MRIITSSLGVSYIASLAVLPFLAANFGETSPWSVPLTPLLVPPLALMLAGGILEVLVPGLPAESLVGVGSSALYALLRFADSLPGTPWVLPPRPALLFSLLSLGWLLLYGRTRCVLPRRVLALASGLALLPWTAAPAHFELHTLDVGHGAATLARGPGLPALLFDAGSRGERDLAKLAIIPLLAAWDVTALDIALSHNHHDHQSALPDLIERFGVRSWSGAAPRELLDKLPPGVSRSDVDGVSSTRIRLPLSVPGIHVELLRGGPGAGNEGSRSLWFLVDGRRLLISGDAVAEGLVVLLEELDGPIELLLLPHHGSNSRWLGALLDRTDPARSWVSCGAPSPAERELARRALPTRVTYRDGPLSLFIGKGFPSFGFYEAGPQPGALGALPPQQGRIP